MIRRKAFVAAGVTLLVGGGAWLGGEAFADPAPSPAAQAAREQPLVAGTPCTVTARACVDLDSQRSWLIEDGKVVRGPVAIASGGNGAETPIGHSLRVYRKDKDHLSQESRKPDGTPAPMPWSVFFEDGGIAFHSGSPGHSSAGCIHLEPADAEAYFTFLQVGDQVQVVRASEEQAARSAADPAPADDSSDADDSDSDG